MSRTLKGKKGNKFPDSERNPISRFILKTAVEKMLNDLNPESALAIRSAMLPEHVKNILFSPDEPFNTKEICKFSEDFTVFFR